MVLKWKYHFLLSIFYIGIDPTYAALGVLTTGALASVAYSYVASDSDIATSATNIAMGAVDAIARNDVVQNLANTDIVKKATGAIGSLAGGKGQRDEYFYPDEKEPGYYYYDYDNIGYSDYDYDYKNEYSHRDPLYGASELQEKKGLPSHIEWYEPNEKPEKSDDVPYIQYNEKHNPWNLMSKGGKTDHLYRSINWRMQ